MADGDQITAKDIAGWLTAPEAHAIVVAAKGQFAARVLNDRLNGGVLTAVATKTSKAVGRGPVTLRETPQKIPPEFWQHRADDSFWNSGDVYFQIRDGRA